jgi:hypothetical protein
MAIPKLALIPSGVKAGKLYSVLPTNGDGDFTTTRNTVATRVNENGLIEEVAANVPRLDYSDGGCPSLLLEPQRTNSLLQSNQFDTTWSATNTVLSSNQIGVGGSTDAWKLESSSNSSETYLRQTTSLSGTSVLTLYAKKGNANFLGVYIGSSGADIIAYFDLNNGVVGNISNTIETDIKSVGNDWYRCTIVGSNINQNVNFYVTDASGNFSSNDGSYIYIQYAQLEQGSYATSYIKTVGTAQTRSADTANGAGNASTFNDSEGVLMMEISSDNPLNDNRIYLSDGSDNNRIFIILDKSQSSIKGYVRGAAGYALAITSVGYDTSLNHKVLIKYKSNDYSFWINGFEVGSETASTILPSGLNQLSFNGVGNYNPFYGNTKQIQYFDSALNDSDLEKLTSYTSFTAMANAQSYTII